MLSLMKNFVILLVISILDRREHISGQRTLLHDSAFSRISYCYDESMIDKYERASMHFDNFLMLLKKIEMDKKMENWGIKQLIFSLLRSYQMNGIFFLSPSVGHIQVVEETAKDALLASIGTDMNNDAFLIPESILSDEEKCLMHWMISHVVNDAIVNDYNASLYGSKVEKINQKSQSRSSKSKAIVKGKSIKNATVWYMKNFNPLELGVVYAINGGTVSLGIVLKSIAFALEEQTVTIKDLIRRSYPYTDFLKAKTVNNLWAASIAGEIAQTSLLDCLKYSQDPSYYNLRASSYGDWNNVGCPNKFILRKESTNMTKSEIYGAIDGLLIGSKISTLNQDNVRLSQILDMYYSNIGLNTDSNFKACNRVNMFKQVAQRDVLKEESRSASYAFYAQMDGFYPMVVGSDYINDINNCVDSAINSLYQAIDENEDFSCISIRSNEQTPSLSNLESNPDVYLVADLYRATDADLQQIKEDALSILGSLQTGFNKSQISIFTASGKNVKQIYFNRMYDDSNGARIRCLFFDTNLEKSNSVIDLSSVFDNLYRVLGNDKRKEKDMRLSISNAKIVILLLYNSFTDTDANSRNQIAFFKREFSDVRIVVVGSDEKYKEVASSTENFVSISSPIWKDSLLKIIKSVPNRLFYHQCRDAFEDERNFYQIIYLTPGLPKSFQIYPKYFHLSSDLKIKFVSKSGPVKLCEGRDFDGQNNNVIFNCNDYNQNTEAQFKYSNPCSDSSSCRSIYFYLLAKEGIKYDMCQDPSCSFPNQVQVTVKHEGLRCGCLSVRTVKLTVAILFLISYMFALK